ncbi:TIGR01777 family oxidoreductase [Candidatus Comchoanobacter bicostacola]|uniref:TIGR01777 family oxidoreductase n=1 Tax=Candidatus Comchoanobacter bicostacola TaxID=2919598 RepID=A0ABY5DMD3_9GAMM|nr:TIGR01777 family oxidoreductase [Candidatus Comchoanobacter bicostacola]UTC24894.1 TIGR01777 family oxidoreductase [Candidatus Comchoanobacter bicostacola]
MDNCRIVILGANGFLARALAKKLANQPVLLISRKPKTPASSKHQAYSWDQLIANPSILKASEHIYSLCGKSLLGLWTQKFKEELINSRTEPIKMLDELLTKINHNPRIYIASGVGYYGHPSTEHTAPFTELDTVHNKNALSHIAHAVENSLSKNRKNNTFYLRIGVVLSNDGGLLPLMKLPHYLFIGAVFGDGKQPMSWISLDDVINAMIHLQSSTQAGAYNLCAPNPTTHGEFTHALSKSLNRTARIRIPTWVAKQSSLVSNTILLGQAVIPEKLLSEGFEFKHPTIKTYLQVS